MTEATGRMTNAFTMPCQTPTRSAGLPSGDRADGMPNLLFADADGG